MNVIISNQKRDMLKGLNIEVIKELHGEFDAEQLASSFKNFFFQKMILDITALKNYKDIKTMQKLSLSLDMNKVILVLDENSTTVSPTFMSQLISLGIYNFTTNLDGIMYLYNSPNSYRDVAHLHLINQTVEEQKPTNIFSSVSAPKESSNNFDGNARILGIKCAAKQSGATTLTYMMKKTLEQYYSVVAIEVDKSDFRFFNDKNMISTTNGNIAEVISKVKNYDVILIDVNNSNNAISMCGDIIYLLEPSIIKLNKMLLINPDILSEMQNKKLVLNQSLLKDKDISDFEFESNLKVFYNLPPLNERIKSSPELNQLLYKLGFTKIS